MSKVNERKALTKEVLKTVTDNFSEFFESQWKNLILENQQLRRMLRISWSEKDALKEFESKIKELEISSLKSENVNDTIDDEPSHLDTINLLLNKAVSETKKRKIK